MGKVFLIFPIIYQTVDLKVICIIGQSDLVNLWSLPTAVLNDTFTHFEGFFSICRGQLALKFYWDKTCVSLTFNYIEITWSVMPKPVYLLTMQEAHKEYNSLTDQIWADQVWAIKVRQVWVSWHPSIQSWSLWIGKSTYSCEPTLPETEPANSKGNIQAHILQALKMLFGSKFIH